MISLPLFDLPNDWRPPREPPNLDGVTIMAVDTETRDPRLLTHGPGFTRGESHPIGASIATDHAAWYFPFRHPEDNCEWQVEAWLQDVFSHHRQYVFCNAMYDVAALSIINAIPNGTWTDIGILQAILNEQFAPGYSLDAMSKYWLGTGKDESALNLALQTYGFQDKSGLWALPARHVGQYATIDAVRTLETYNKQWPEIAREDLVGVIQLEEALLPLIWKMVSKGINFDWVHGAELYERFGEEARKLNEDIYIKAGMRVDPNSSKSIARYCFANGIAFNTTAKGNPSFTAEFLSEAKEPILASIGRMRRLEKMRSFIEAWFDYRGSDGRIHPQWLTTMAEEGGTRSGRFASCDPNLQQVPIRDPEFGPQMRALWLPEEGKKWGKLDVQSQEIRIAVHYAFKAKCTGADEMVQAYCDNPRMDFHSRVAGMADVDRNSAKTISLGSLYGMSQKTLAHKLGFSQNHAHHVYHAYHAAVPFFQELAQTCLSTAADRGYVKTFLGRKRRFPDKANVHKALNAVVQGTAADQLKTMMLNVNEEMDLVPMVCVHDELGYSVESIEQLKRIGEIMETSLQFSVPMVVDCSIADTWNQK